MRQSKNTVDPEYVKFILGKSQIGDCHGFEPTFLPDCLKPFQRAMDEWSIRKGRAALYPRAQENRKNGAAFGMGPKRR